MDNNIVIKNVDKFYGNKQALYNIDLTIGKGMFGLLGRNGAGKTTLMKMLAALHQKKKGEITVCGIPIEKAGQIRAVTGYLPQDFSMYPSMRTDEALEYLGILSGMKSGDLKKRVTSLLRRVNLIEHRHKKVKQLSGGMKRRLGIAQALIHDPKVLIVDEPTAGLDPEERIRFRNLLCEVAEDRIVILSTHIVGDIEAACEQIAIMDEGRILWRGTVSELVKKAEGHVYTVNVEKKFMPQIKKEYIVTGMLAQTEYTTVRIVSDSEPDLPNAVLTEPDLEAAYMYCLHSSGCDVKGGEE
ncbi:MAG: ABC transporter ATP-binding protein [Ruminococcus sp.]|uniref:ABC transporter ATP-binding protein n=1 Tax=Ruminococcus sp. TaxID=41978 RepID=UPI0025CF6C8C|nr:ABC transporter ATP-binding protein [Ruminococcus sp.]MCR5600771.1 ABC transporter ATP-binding protein [Ruminococcus sp.]